MPQKIQGNPVMAPQEVGNKTQPVQLEGLIVARVARKSGVSARFVQRNRRPTIDSWFMVNERALITEPAVPLAAVALLAAAMVARPAAPLVAMGVFLAVVRMLAAPQLQAVEELLAPVESPAFLSAE